MKNIEDRAHEILLKLIEIDKTGFDVEGIAGYAYEIAKAMQAEALKCKRQKVKDLLNDKSTFLEREGQHFDDVNFEIDWSQAPSFAKWWAMDESMKARWLLSKGGKPYLSTGFTGRWFEIGDYFSEDAPSFNYQGDWKDSLRKRPDAL